ncbi:WhiB family transcriptional regulator [Pseudonocardia halophobica]|uniref:WhiB family transcriptional regulator n=1 Tax=Pseudonocardia halophobica TaxID=29401 RepID=UPI003D8D7E9A
MESAVRPRVIVGVGGRGSHPRGTDDPRLCRRCPVQATCLDWVLVTGAQGVLGGQEPDRRRAIRARLLAELGGRSMARSPEPAEVVRTRTPSRISSQRTK